MPTEPYLEAIVTHSDCRAFELIEDAYVAQAKWNYFKFQPRHMSRLNSEQKTSCPLPDDQEQKPVPVRELSYDSLIITVRIVFQ